MTNLGVLMLFKDCCREKGKEKEIEWDRERLSLVWVIRDPIVLSAYAVAKSS